VFRRSKSAYYIQCYIGATIQYRVSGHVQTTIGHPITFIDFLCQTSNLKHFEAYCEKWTDRFKVSWTNISWNQLVDRIRFRHEM